MNDILQLKQIIEDSESIVFFGGAGVSVHSGIPDFRSTDGIYKKNAALSPETILSADFFKNHTAEFYEFYKSQMLYPDVVPNSVHYALAELEKEGKLSAIITQNIDGLHQLAGSKNVIELHGNSNRNYCLRCGKEHDMQYILQSDGVPRCSKCGGVIKPDVVLYGESLCGRTVTEAEEAIFYADTLIVGGTSLSVYPAAGFVLNFEGENLVVINNSETSADGMATLVINDDLESVFDSLQG